MDDTAYLKKLEENNSHVSALAEALKTANKRHVQAAAQAVEIKNAAEKRMREMLSLIDTLHSRIEVMCDEWIAQVMAGEKKSEEEKEEYVRRVIEPFRPVRIGGDKIQ